MKLPQGEGIIKYIMPEGEECGLSEIINGQGFMVTNRTLRKFPTMEIVRDCPNCAEALANNSIIGYSGFINVIDLCSPKIGLGKRVLFFPQIITRIFNGILYVIQLKNVITTGENKGIYISLKKLDYNNDSISETIVRYDDPDYFSYVILSPLDDYALGYVFTDPDDSQIVYYRQYNWDDLNYNDFLLNDTSLMNFSKSLWDKYTYYDKPSPCFPFNGVGPYYEIPTYIFNRLKCWNNYTNYTGGTIHQIGDAFFDNLTQTYRYQTTDRYTIIRNKELPKNVKEGDIVKFSFIGCAELINYDYSVSPLQITRSGINYNAYIEASGFSASNIILPLNSYEADNYCVIDITVGDPTGDLKIIFPYVELQCITSPGSPSYLLQSQEAFACIAAEGLAKKIEIKYCPPTMITLPTFDPIINGAFFKYYIGCKYTNNPVRGEEQFSIDDYHVYLFVNGEIQDITNGFDPEYEAYYYYNAYFNDTDSAFFYNNFIGYIPIYYSFANLTHSADNKLFISTSTQTKYYDLDNEFPITDKYAVGGEYNRFTNSEEFHSIPWQDIPTKQYVHMFQKGKFGGVLLRNNKHYFAVIDGYCSEGPERIDNLIITDSKFRVHMYNLNFEFIKVAEVPLPFESNLVYLNSGGIAYENYNPSNWYEQEYGVNANNNMLVTDDDKIYFIYEDRQNKHIGIIGIDPIAENIFYHYRHDAEIITWPIFNIDYNTTSVKPAQLGNKLYLYGSWLGFCVGDDGDGYQKWIIVGNKAA